jgi:hypothetical protein
MRWSSLLVVIFSTDFLHKGFPAIAGWKSAGEINPVLAEIQINSQLITFIF